MASRDHVQLGNVRHREIKRPTGGCRSGGIPHTISDHRKGELRMHSTFFETRSYHLTGLTEMLGTKPSNSEIYTDYIASKAPAGTHTDDEISALPNDLERGKTVFLLDPKTGAVCVQDYMIRGYLKSAMTALVTVNGVKAPNSKIDRYVFVSPRMIPLRRQGTGALIYEADLNFERTLRAQTMQGPRITLACSELVDNWELDFDIQLIENSGTKASGKIDWKILEQALDYGMLCGLGQWRNGSYGRFRWNRTDNGEEIRSEAEQRALFGA